jgi:poly-gamma-glutamate synthesis protein (capsule biosynthesis protein)
VTIGAVVCSLSLWCLVVSASLPASARSGDGAHANGDTTIRLVFGGDVLMHSPLWRQAARNAREEGREGLDFRPMFDDVRGLLRGADLAVCHLETPVAPPGERLSTYPLFGVPREVVPALADAGFGHCSTASNHVLDRGVAGIEATMAALGRAGITQSGMARDASGAEPFIRDVAGVQVALLSYTYGYNGIRPPAGEPWRSNLIDPARILRDAAVARTRGAQVVVASMHWGIERSHMPSDEQRRVARAITVPGGVDLIVGHHAHVLQPIEPVNGKWVLYGLSNLVSNMPVDSRWPAASQDAALVEVSVIVGPGGVAVARPVAHPTWVDKRGGWAIRILTPRSATRLGADARASLDRTREILEGFLAPGPPVPSRS